MNVSLSPDDLRPLVEQVVAATLERIEADQARTQGRLAYREAEAAALIGIPAHSLRDARLRGEIAASRVGSRVLYTRAELLRYLAATRED